MLEKPVLKWVGGKSQIIEQVLSHFPIEMNHYHEPFVGGGSVLLGLLSIVQSGKIRISGNIYASDLNATLIHFYKNLQSHPSELFQRVSQIILEFQTITGNIVNRKAGTFEEASTSPESYYYWIRSRFNALSNKDRTTPLASAMLLFLNKTCFRGVYREGPNGFNVPYGHYKNPSIVDKDHFYRVSKLLQPVIFQIGSFTETLSTVQENDFVYLDPPYAPESSNSFVSYTVNGFDIQQHTSLFDKCHQMTFEKVRFLMSNADVPTVKDAFPSPPYTLHTISCRRAIHSKKPDSKTNEVFILNK